MLGSYIEQVTPQDLTCYVTNSRDHDTRWADEAFTRFWSVYPRKAGKLAAKRKWDQIRPTEALVEQIFSTLAWQRTQWRDPKYIPHPATWLHQGRWDDEDATKGMPRQAESATSGDLLEGWGYCFHTPRCTDSDVCRALRAKEKKA